MSEASSFPPLIQTQGIIIKVKINDQNKRQKDDIKRCAMLQFELSFPKLGRAPQVYFLYTVLGIISHTQTKSCIMSIQIVKIRTKSRVKEASEAIDPWPWGDHIWLFVEKYNRHNDIVMILTPWTPRNRQKLTVGYIIFSCCNL